MKNILWPVGWRVFLVLIFSTLTAQIQAQNRSATVEKKYQPLKIGDELPDHIWSLPLEVINSKKIKQLGDDKSKLIILALWGSTCSSATNEMIRINRLSQFSSPMVSLKPVTKQDSLGLFSYMSSKQKATLSRISTVVNDNVFSQLFPHLGEPYIIWIKDGKVLNMTDSSQLTDQTINEILNNRLSSLQTVIHEDPDKSLFLSETFANYTEAKILSRSMLIKGMINGFGTSKGGAIRRDRNGNITGRLFTNRTLADLFFSIGMDVFRNKGEKVLFNDKRIRYHVQHIDYIKPSKNDLIFYNSNLYTYEINNASDQNGLLYNHIINELNRDLPYKIEFKNETTSCLALVKNSDKDKIATKGGETAMNFGTSYSNLKNAPIASLVNILNAWDFITLPIIDDTDYMGRVDINLKEVTGILSLKNKLSKYDLTLIPVQREILMLVISDNK